MQQTHRTCAIQTPGVNRRTGPFHQSGSLVWRHCAETAGCRRGSFDRTLCHTSTGIGFTHDSIYFHLPCDPAFLIAVGA